MSEVLLRERGRLVARELRWLMRLRWVAGTVLIVGGLINWRWLGWYNLTYGPVALGAAVVIINAALWWAMRRFAVLRTGVEGLLAFASVQIYLDLAFLTVIAVRTGGFTSPALGFVVVHGVFAGLLQPRMRAYAAALLAIVMMSAGLRLAGEWPGDRETLLLGAGWACTLLMATYAADRIARSLYRREVSRVRQIARAREATARLRETQDAMVQHEKLVAIGQLAAGVAHEITNPLAGMDSALQLMQRKNSTPSPETVGALREQIQRIQRTIRQLTSFAHPGKGRSELLELNGVVRSSLDMVGMDGRVAKARIVRELDEGVGAVPVNPHALQQVLTNLVLNATDAVAGATDPRITVRTRREGAACVIEVSDNGTGIAPEHLPRIFEPFFTTKPIGRGTGLGLSICAKLVREQGGEIRVASEVGRGSTFSVRLPVSAGAAPRERVAETATART